MPNSRMRFLWAYAEYIRQAFYSIIIRDKYDCFVFMEANVGILSSFIAVLLHVKMPKIILLNLIPKESGRLKSGINRFYRISFKNITTFSISSKMLIPIYQNRFKMIVKPFVIPDNIHFYNKFQGPEGDYIFSGGCSHRDWTILMEAAKRLSKLKFIIFADFMDKNIFHPLKNVTLRFNVPTSEFYKTLSQARLVVLPIKYETVAAGHLVILHALYYGRAIIASKTAGISEYIEDGFNGLLVPTADLEELTFKIQMIMASKKLRNKLSENAIISSNKYNRENYIRNVLDMMKTVMEG